MLVRLSRSLLLVAAVALWAPAGASAQGVGSAVDQYRENVPSAGSSSRGERPSRAQSDALRREGRDGEQLARVLGSADSGTNAPAGTSTSRSDARDRDDQPSGRGTARGGEDGTADRAASPGDRSAVEAAATASLGSDAGPTKLWILLVLVLVVSAGIGALRRRRA